MSKNHISSEHIRKSANFDKRIYVFRVLENLLITYVEVAFLHSDSTNKHNWEQYNAVNIEGKRKS